MFHLSYRSMKASVPDRECRGLIRATTLSEEEIVRNLLNDLKGPADRRSFMKKGLAAAGATTVGVGLLANGVSVFGQEEEEDSGILTRGDAAILRFLQALETIEADLWQQYAELGGATSQPGMSKIDLPFPTGLAPAYIAALQFLDGDMPQYIDDNTDDEFTHADFLKAYLQSKGAETVHLDKDFANLPPSRVTGVPQKGRITNLMQLTVDTSWWTRYRSDSENPDFGDTFDQAIPTLAVGQHSAIPRDDGDLAGNDLTTTPPTITPHLQAIANTAGFHFGFIESGGTSLYPSLAQRVTSPQVLRILLSIGPTEAMHFQTWHDKAGNAPNVTDGGLSFPKLNATSNPDEFQTNLIMPEPTIFLNKKFPICSIVRPTQTKGAAMGALTALTNDGLFIGQSKQFFALLRDLAEDADAARREG